MSATPPDGLPVAGLISSSSVELSVSDRNRIDDCRVYLRSRTTVYVHIGRSDSYAEIISTSLQLTRAGLHPVPHIAARYLTGFGEFDNVLRGVRHDVGSDQLFLIAGDCDNSIGPYRSSLDLIETGLFGKYGFRSIGVAGYPEGHPKLSRSTLDTALRLKLAMLERNGVDPYIVTQACFDAATIVAWIERIRQAGIKVPVRVGLAGPARTATLAKFALRYGIGGSIRVHAHTHDRPRIGAHPEKIIADLCRVDLRGLGPVGLHFFSFGGGQRTSQWLSAFVGRHANSPGIHAFEAKE